MLYELRSKYHMTMVKLLDKLFLKGEEDLSKMNQFQKLVVKVMQYHYGIAYKLFCRETHK